MSLPLNDAAASRTRWGIYVLLMALGLGGMMGRIFAVNSVNVLDLEKRRRVEDQRPDWQLQRPFLSANDRSRWCTIRALVEHGTYAIDDIVQQKGWDTIDMVKHDGHGNSAPGVDEGHLYSSKPPLLATLYAGPYWLIVRSTGATLGTHPYAIGRALLVLFNILPFGLMLVSIARLAERYAANDWSRVFVVAAATFATFQTTFVTVLNNHLPGAVCVAIVLDLTTGIVLDGRREPWRFVLAGLAAAMCVACELPALSLAAMVTVGLLVCAPRKTLVAFTPAALVVVAAHFGTNYAAHETLRPPYAERHKVGGWYDFQYVANGKVRDSYFGPRGARSDVDRGEPDPGVYAFHALVGHHGIFSLTPMWLLSVFGTLRMASTPGRWRLMGLAVLLVSVVCVTFFVLRPLEDRNYGGMTSGFRWVFWLAPLWLFAMLPALDWCASRRWAQVLCAALLGASALSVSYPTWNPWVHPWLFDFLSHLDLVRLGGS